MSVTNSAPRRGESLHRAVSRDVVDGKKLTDIHIQSSTGEKVLSYDPNTFKIDSDIRVACVVAQLYRNLGLQPEVTVRLPEKDGSATLLRLGNIKPLDD